MTINSKREVKPIKQRTFLNKDAEGLKSDLLTYTQAFYSTRIKDFSDASVGGMFLDLAAGVGDTMAFYLDHQFGELFSETAVEQTNIEKNLRKAGVEITGNSPATVRLSFFIEVPAVKIGTAYQPLFSALPVIQQGTICAANNGTRFEILNDIDFSEKDEDDNYLATFVIGSQLADGTPATLIMRRDVDAVSGFTRTESFTIDNTFVPFRQITLSSENITEIKSALDSDGNEYFKVGALSEDTIFRAIPNLNQDDNKFVQNILEIVPAPYRYISQVSLQTRMTTMTFGGGTATSLDNDAIPDPSEFAVPLYGKKTFERFAINPNNLLNTRTLGIAPQGTTLTVIYRYGGGLSHNVSAETIRTVSTLLMLFPNNPSSAIAAQVRATVDVLNIDKANGGENAPTINELKSKIPAAKNAQKRIASREDVLARIYSMPSNFGRVFRAGARDNLNNPQSLLLYIISRDSNGNLTTSPDTLKDNLVVFLNSFRMLSDGIDILDAPFVNLGLDFEIATDSNANKNLVLKNVISRLQKFFKIENFQIDQPIKIDDIRNIIFNNPGVLSVSNIKFKNLSGVIKERNYSNNTFNVATHTIKGLLFPPAGGIFEVKFPNFDLVGQAI